MGDRRSYLAAMGIDVWHVRTSASAATPPQPVVQATRPAIRVAPAACANDSPAPTRASVVVREAPPPTPAPAQATDARGDVASMDWEKLRAVVATCRACPLHVGRTQTVFGVGDPQADWLFIGEAPGAEEDRQGEPFVGRAGQLLNSILFALGMSREGVYIANILKCRPPKNRDPEPAEARCCRPFLDRQVALIAPKIIVGLGRIAAQQLLQTDTPIGRLRGRIHQYTAGDRQIPTIVTYHPAYLLRSPNEKPKVWADLQLARHAAGVSP